MNSVIGIDPGFHGGIAKLNVNGKIMSVMKMPDTPKDIFETLEALIDDDSVVYLEDVGQGMPGQSSSATAKFARHNGHLEMALIALRVPFVKVRPQTWERSYALGKSSDYEKKTWKNRLKQRAQELFPDVKKMTLVICDALLIAEYGRQTQNNINNFINTNKQ